MIFGMNNTRIMETLFVFGVMTLYVSTILVSSFPITRTTVWSSSSSSSSYPSFLSTRRYAKPPPISNFNLEDILAMEQKLDQEEEEAKQQQQQQEMNDNDWEEDDDVSLEDEDDGETTVEMYTVTEELQNQRLDAIVSAMLPEKSRSYCSSLVSNGNVWMMVDDEDSGTKQVLTRKSTRVEKDTVLYVQQVTNEKPSEIVAENIPLEILFEDEHMIVLNKAADMVVHPAAGNWDGTVVNALAYYLTHTSPFGPGEFVTTGRKEDELDSVGEALFFRPGIVHRLDKGTTGILVVAKTQEALANLSQAFASRQVKKTYLAITVGNPGQRVVIDKPIGRHPLHRQRMRVVPEPTSSMKRQRVGVGSKKGGKKKKNTNSGSGSGSTMTVAQKGRRALSFVDTLAFDGKLSLVKVRIETGRTHQIRVHLKDRHTPIYGDDVYGLADWNKQLKKSFQMERPLLHAHRLELNHPITQQPYTFLAPMPSDMTTIASLIFPNGPSERPDIFDPTTAAATTTDDNDNDDFISDDDDQPSASSTLESSQDTETSEEDEEDAFWS